MSRKPITEMHTNKLRGYQAIWAIIMELHKTAENFTLTDIEQRTNAARNGVREHLKRFERGGYVEQSGTKPQTGTGKSHQKVYKVIKPTKVAPRLKRDGSIVTAGLGNDHMWRAMKMIGRFTAQELALAASTSDVKVEKTTAKQYIHMLSKAGYLTDLGNGVHSLLPSKNTGPKAPMIQRIKHVFDPNTGKVVWKEDANG